MDKNEDSGSPGWGSSFFKQTTEDVARAFLAAASAATVRSTRPSVVFSSRDDNSNSQLHKLQSQVTRALKGFSPPPEVKGAYNPEVLTSQKRQWSRFQLQSLVKLLSLSLSQCLQLCLRLRLPTSWAGELSFVDGRDLGSLPHSFQLLARLKTCIGSQKAHFGLVTQMDELWYDI